MSKLALLYKHSPGFYNLVAIFILLLVVVLVLLGARNSFLWLNGFQSQQVGAFFQYYTYLGDGITLTLISVLILLYRFKNGLFCLASYAISGLIAQFFKLMVFENELRPLAYFERINQNINTIDGVQLALYNSFPSGHTAAAFAFATSCAISIKNKTGHVVLAILASLVGVSRVYLAQHFIVDVLGGTVVGVLSAVILAISFPNYFKWTN